MKINKDAVFVIFLLIASFSIAISFAIYELSMEEKGKDICNDKELDYYKINYRDNSVSCLNEDGDIKVFNLYPKRKAGER